MMSACFQALELRTYSRAGVVLTVSQTDLSTLRAALSESSGGQSLEKPLPLVSCLSSYLVLQSRIVGSECQASQTIPNSAKDGHPKACMMFSCHSSHHSSASISQIREVPFSATTATTINSLSDRQTGAMLYVGTCHPIAKAGVLWLLHQVFPKLASLAHKAGMAEKIKLHLVGNGWQALGASSPFSDWIAKGWLQLHGKLDDAALEAQYAKASIFISPLLNATVGLFRAVGYPHNLRILGCSLDDP